MTTDPIVIPELPDLVDEAGVVASAVPPESPTGSFAVVSLVFVFVVVVDSAATDSDAPAAAPASELRPPTPSAPGRPENAARRTSAVTARTGGTFSPVPGAFAGVVKPWSSRYPAQPVSSQVANTTAIIVRPSRVADVTSVRLAASVNPVFRPVAPG